jgi:uncharacterized protein
VALPFGSTAFAGIVSKRLGSTYLGQLDQPLPTKGIDPVMKNIKEHLEFQVALEKQGIMFAAGPNWSDDEKSWEGDGMVVIRAKSLAEATEIMKRDPMHKSGARKFKIRPWFVNEGTVSVRLNYSQGTFEMV